MPERLSKRTRKQKILVMTQGEVFPGHMVQVQACESASAKKNSSRRRLLFHMYAHDHLPFSSVALIYLIESYFPYMLHTTIHKYVPSSPIASRNLCFSPLLVPHQKYPHLTETPNVACGSGLHSFPESKHLF